MNRKYVLELTEAEAYAVARALDIAITVSKRVAHGKKITFRPLGRPLAGPDPTERPAAKRALKRLAELILKETP